MAKTAKQWAVELQADPCVSYWLKETIFVLLDRDPVDALRDVEILHQVIQRHASECLHPRRNIWDGKSAGDGTFERGE